MVQGIPLPRPAEVVPFPRARIGDEEAPPYDGVAPRREPFAMMPRWVLERHAAELGLAAWGVLTALVHHADHAGRCFPSRKRIADLLGIHPNTVTDAIAKLSAAGLVAVESRRTDTGSQTSNAYVLPFLCPTPTTEGGTSRTEPPSVLDVPPLRLGLSKREPLNENQKNENGEYPPTPRKSSQVSYPADFEAWWAKYPRGRGTKKVAAEKWRRLDAADRAAASVGLDAWLASDQWQRDGGRFVVWAERFLERRVWENEPPPPVPPAPSPVANSYRNGARPLSEWTDDELLDWSAPPGHKGGVPFEVRQAQIRYYKEHGL